MQFVARAEKKSLVLDCGCGEKLVIFGRLEDWLPRNPVFRCECGQNLTLEDRAGEDVELAVRSPTRPHGAR